MLELSVKATSQGGRGSPPFLTSTVVETQATQDKALAPP